MSSPSATSAVFEIKSADLPMVAFQLKSYVLEQVDVALQAQLQHSPGFFDNDPVLIDLESLPEDSPVPEFGTLVAVLGKHGLRALAVRTSRPDWLMAAGAAGLVRADEARIRRQVAVTTPAQPVPQVPLSAPSTPAQVLDKPLRSGQQFYARGADLIVLAMVNPGAEVLADGNIHVYAPLRGKAIAGARGHTASRIFALNMDPELISIAGVYRTSENPLPPQVRGQAAQVSLQHTDDGDRLIITALQA